MIEDTIAGIASGMGGGIGIIRVSGIDSLKIVSSIFRVGKNRKRNDQFLVESNSHTIHYGFIVEENEDVIDEVMVLLMKKPLSYTTEDVVEIDCHGGPFVVHKILKRVLAAGARLAEPGEFTKRAFLNGRIDLSQAEAVMKMISSENEFALKSSLDQLEGSTSKYIEEIRKNILHDMGYIECALDDPEHYELDGFSDSVLEHVKENIIQLRELLECFDNGRMKSEGIKTVIVGKPNAGKSSLMNMLLDENRAIVTDVAGTTRDILEETVRLGDVILKLVDTAGIHETTDFVENIGVNKAIESIETADFVLFVVDSSTSWSDEDEQIASYVSSKKGVILLNKSDLDNVLKVGQIKNILDWKTISFSNKTKEGFDELENYIINQFLDGNITYNNQILLSNSRQFDAVHKAVQSLEQVKQSIEDGMPEDFFTIDMMDAYRELGLINGETATEDLINKIFKDFCMGK